jgi:predicted Rdx family selenoprotein
VELVAGGGGIFDVEHAGRMLFSKHRAGRFPEPGEVLAALQGSGD